MSSLETASTRLAFDDILEAVQESRRGRWFLQEYENRLQQRDSKSVLDAINRLEARMGSMGASAPDELSRVRTAITNARHDLLKLGLGKQAMSEEGRMFSQLAEMARKAVQPDSSPGILRSLQLVDEIERAVMPESGDRGASYFAADAQVFEKPPVAAKPALVQKTEPAVEPKKPDVVPSAGAKLIIRRANADGSEAVVTGSLAPVSPSTPEATDKHNDPVISDHPRISIVRRKSDDMTDIADGSASAA